MSFGEYMRQHVWQPLGMNDTRMDDPLDVIPNRVRGYQLVNGQVKNSEFIDISSRFGGGGTRSTVPDMLKFAKGVMDQKILKPETWNVMLTSMSTKAGRLTNYGMGWETTPYNGRYMLVHSGGQQETRTLLYIIPGQRMAIAVGLNFEGSNPGTYVERLFQLLTGAPVEMNLYSPDKLKNATLLAVKGTFDYGMAAFERSGKLAASDQEIAEAFAAFNSALDPETVRANPQEAMAKIGQGVHPVSKQAFTKVGAYMAQRLAAKAALHSYPIKGGLAFFEDYIALTKTDAGIPKEMRFKESFETQVAAMSRDWNRSNTEYMRQLWLLPDSDLDALAKTMRQSFTGISVYPNLVDDLFSVMRQFVLRGENAGAIKAGRLAVEFYPEHPLAQFMTGFASLLNNDQAGAVAAFKKSSSINPGGPASAGGLNGIAYQLAGVGQVDHALAVLQVAIQLYPKEANLYDSTGEFLLRKGEKAKALASYKKALEINPEFSNAAAAKDIVTKLSNELSANGSK